MKLSSVLGIFLREGLDFVSTLQLFFDTVFPEGVNTQHQEWLIFQRNKRGKHLLLYMAGEESVPFSSLLLVLPWQ